MSEDSDKKQPPALPPRKPVTASPKKKNRFGGKKQLPKIPVPKVIVRKDGSVPKLFRSISDERNINSIKIIVKDMALGNDDGEKDEDDENEEDLLDEIVEGEKIVEYDSNSKKPPPPPRVKPDLKKLEEEENEEEGETEEEETFFKKVIHKPAPPIIPAGPKVSTNLEEVKRKKNSVPPPIPMKPKPSKGVDGEEIDTKNNDDGEKVDKGNNIESDTDSDSDENSNSDSEDEDFKALRLKLLQGDKKTTTRRQNIIFRSFFQSVEKYFSPPDYVEFKEFCIYIAGSPPRDEDSWENLITYLYEKLRENWTLVKNFQSFVHPLFHKKFQSILRRVEKQKAREKKKLIELNSSSSNNNNSGSSSIEAQKNQMYLEEQERIKIEEEQWKSAKKERKRIKKLKLKLEREKDKLEVEKYQKEERLRKQRLEKQQLLESKKKKYQLNQSIQHKKLIGYISKNQISSIIDFIEDHEGLIDINRYYSGFSVLHWCCFYGRKNVLAYFIEAFSNDLIYNCVSKKYPAQNSHESSSSKKEKESSSKIGKKLTPLLIASKKNFVKLIDLMLKTKKFDFMARTEKGISGDEMSSNKKIIKLIKKEFREKMNLIETHDSKFLFMRSKEYLWNNKKDSSKIVFCVGEEAEEEEYMVSNFVLGRILMEGGARMCEGGPRKIKVSTNIYVVEKVLGYLHGQSVKIKKKSLYSVYRLSVSLNLFGLMYLICMKVVESLEFDGIVKRLKGMEMRIGEKKEKEWDGFEMSLIKKLQMKFVPEMLNWLNLYQKRRKESDESDENENDRVVKDVFEKIISGEVGLIGNILNNSDFANCHFECFGKSSYDLLNDYIDKRLNDDDLTKDFKLLSCDNQVLNVNQQVLIFRCNYLFRILQSNPSLKEIQLEQFDFDELKVFYKWIVKRKLEEKGDDNLHLRMLFKCLGLKNIDQPMKTTIVDWIIKILKRGGENMRIIKFILKFGYLLNEEDGKGGPLTKRIKKVLVKQDHPFEYESKFVDQLFEQSIAFHERIKQIKNSGDRTTFFIDTIM